MFLFLMFAVKNSKNRFFACGPAAVITEGAAMETDTDAVGICSCLFSSLGSIRSLI